MNGFPEPVKKPGDEGYDVSSTSYNRVLEYRPDLVVPATTSDHVVAAVEQAGRTGTPVAVHSTGHGPSVAVETGVLIDVSRMTGVRVDEQSRTAWVSAGTRWQEVLAATAPLGLAPLSGSSPVVGVAGFVTGGGIGMLGRRYGFAADHVRELELVTADGRLRKVSPEQDPDLFWAVRGGKGNFGVVVSMGLELLPVSTLYGGGLYYSGEHVAQALHAYAEWTTSVPDEMTTSVLLIQVPDIEGLPGPLRGKFVMHLRVAYCGTPEDGDRWLKPMRDAAPQLMDTVAEIPYAQVPAIHHEPLQGLPGYSRNIALGPVGADWATALLAIAGPGAGAPYGVEVRHLGGAYAREPEVPNAVGGRDAAFSLTANSLVAQAERAVLAEAHERLQRQMRPWATGGRLLNFLGVADADPEIVRTAFRPADYERLTAVKASYDPANIFRLNHNIPPAA